MLQATSSIKKDPPFWQVGDQGWHKCKVANHYSSSTHAHYNNYCHIRNGQGGLTMSPFNNKISTQEFVSNNDQTHPQQVKVMAAQATS